MRTTTDMWTYREGVVAPDVSTRNVVGYGVEATDGSIGKVDEATYDVGSSYLVVDTGPWIFGKKVMLPAGVIESVDHDDEKIMVDRSKDEIKSSPEFDDSVIADEGYRTRLGSYYYEGGRSPTPRRRVGNGGRAVCAASIVSGFSPGWRSSSPRRPGPWSAPVALRMVAP